MPRAKGGIFGGEGLGPPGVLVCLLFCVAATLILDWGVLPPSVHVSQPSPVDFAARTSFTYIDQDELFRLREEAALRAPHVYVEEDQWEEKILGDLEKLVDIAEKAQSEADAVEKLRAERFEPPETGPTYEKLLLELHRHKSGPLVKRTMNAFREAIKREFANNAILSDEDYRKEALKLDSRLLRVSGKQEAVPVESRIRMSDAQDEIKRESFRGLDPSLYGLQWELGNYLQKKMRPGVVPDEERSDKKRGEAQAKVGRGEVHVAKGDLILKKGLLVRQATLVKLRREYEAVKESMTWPQRLTRWAGLFMLPAGILAIFFIIAGRVEPAIWSRRRALLMLAAVCLLALFICRLLLVVEWSLACAPFIFVGMTASLVFGQTMTLLVLMGLGFLSACAAVGWQAVPIDGGMPFLSLTMIVGAVCAAIPAEKLRDRWDLLKYGAVGGLLQGSLVAGLTLLRGEAGADMDAAAQWPQGGLPTLVDALIAGCNGPAYGLLVLGSLPIIERAFGILTNIRLFELADMNQPALRRIQLQAPGTFAHTLQVRFLAEPASDAIGADTRLVSAGVLYHDLGKTLKPEYFVENDPEAAERHRRLKPSVSALLIISHVKDGIDLAHEYGLPQQIIDFIPEHHGTTLVSYFYHTAVRDAEKGATAEGVSNGVEVEEAFFRYPGPKPRTRETAVVMLADTIEAASRTLRTPSATRLQQMVHDLLMEKMLDNQLDECGLTFADLALIEDAFLRVLATSLHSRIRYPGQEEEGDDEREPEADEAQAAPVRDRADAPKA